MCKVAGLRQSAKTVRHVWCLLYWSIIVLSLSLLVHAERLPVRVFTSADGLGSSFVNHLMRDSRGFLWFATRDGLSRFDGSRFVTYQVGSEDAAPGIESVFETSKGIYFIATTGGLYRYDPNSTPPVPQTGNARPILNAQHIEKGRGSFYEDRDGRLWYWGGGNLDILEDNNGTVSFQRVELRLPENSTAAFVITGVSGARDGSIWIATSRGILRRLPDKRDIFYNIEKTRMELFTSVLEDDSGRMWVTTASAIYVLMPDEIPAGTEGGADMMVRKLDALAISQNDKPPRMPEKSGEIFRFASIEGLENSPTKRIYKSGDGHIWISTAAGIIEFDGKKFHSFTAEQGFTGGNGKMVEDLDGNLWLGGDKNLVRLDRGGLTTFDTADGFRTPGVLAIGESRDGKLYTASIDFHVSQFDGEKFQGARAAGADRCAHHVALKRGLARQSR